MSAPQLGGLLADLAGSFTPVFVLSVAMAVLGAVASWQLPRTPAPVGGAGSADRPPAHD